MNKAVYDDLIKQAMSEGQEGGLDDVIKYIDVYIDKNPNTLEAYIVRSEFFTEIESFEEALDDAEKAIKINPNEAVAYNNRGCIYIKAGGDINKGLADFNKAIMLDPKYVDAYGNRANVYLKMREPQKAIDDCTRAIEMSPDKCEGAYFNRGLAYANIDEPEKALDDYNNVIRLAPDNAEAYAKRGLLNSHFYNIQEAINDYEKFLQLDPENKNADLVKDELKKLKSGKTINNDTKPVNKEQRLLFICSAICFVIGTIMGANSHNVLMGMWFGLGSGVAFSFFPDIPGIFRRFYREQGFGEALKSTFLGGGIWFLIFMVAGPIGFIIRFIKTR